MPDLIATSAVAATTVLSLALFVVAAVSYARNRRRRFLLLVLAFGGFLAKGLVLTWGLFTRSPDQLAGLFAAGAVLDAGVLAALYLALASR
jgi:drug/metabolite transporter (DMT)-like permease